MGPIAGLGISMAGAVSGEVANEVGYGIGNLTGYNRRREQDQLRQQQALTNMQSQANMGLMNASYDRQLQMWKDTNANAQIEQYKMAGLNPALMYAKGGAGGQTGSGSASVGGGQASNTAQMQGAQTQQTAMGLQMMKMQSEIDVNKSVAELNKANASRSGAETATTEQSRPYLVEKLRQEGAGNWIDNLRKQYENNPEGNDGTVYKNRTTGTVTSFSDEGLFNQQRTSQILQAEAAAGNSNANALLANNKAQGYFKELLNDTIRANSTAIQATATKLASEWNTGEFTNWKTWADLAKGVVQTLVPLAK